MNAAVDKATPARGLAGLLRLDGRVALVTGAGAGIGEAVALGLALQGARVALLDRDEPAAASVASAVRATGGTAMAFRCDVSDPAATAEALQAAAQTWDRLDIVVNSAGVTSPPGMPFTRNTPADWDRVLAINLQGAFNVCKAAHPWLMRSASPRITNISSVTALISAAYMPPYTVSKAALISLTKVLARELAPQHVAVNAVCPGFIWTPLWEHLGDEMARHSDGAQGADGPAVFAQRVQQHVPMQRPQTVEDVANLVAFLCSDAGANITGQVISVDGGVTI